MGEGCHLAILVKHRYVCFVCCLVHGSTIKDQGARMKKREKNKSYSPLAATGSLCLSRSR